MPRPWIHGALTFAAAAVCFTATRPDNEIPFAKHTLDLSQNEPAAFADINGDGRLDVVSGENWYEGPNWTRHHFRDIFFSNNYIDDFSDLPLDVNGDGAVDIVSCGWFQKRLWWSENPGKAAGPAIWKDHDIQTGFNVEFCFAVDLLNDGKKQQVLPQFGNVEAPLSWYEMQGGKFVRHIVSPKSYGHGVGAGDVNGDGRNDILTQKGWLEAPANPRREGAWTFHPDWELGDTGFIYMKDINGDGKSDVITSAAHNYGVFWMEQMPDAKWKKHVIDESWSQAHAMTMVDLNGDGQPDLLTGKRFMAHNGKDPGEREPLGVYWYEYLKPDAGGNVEWVKHVVDYGTRTGGGMQIAVADYDNDGNPDFVVGGKSGLFLFQNQSTRNQSRKRSDGGSGNFTSLYNGKDLTGWRLVNGKGPGYLAQGDEIVCPKEGGGNLFTEKEYSNFALRFEFLLTAGANNGIGIRAPFEGDAAYQGMEIQILDHDDKQYAGRLKPAQHHGSIYDVVPARTSALKPLGEWNSEEIVADGRHIRVTLNGTVLVDANLDEVKDPAVLAKHPGLARASGHIGMLGHGTLVRFRNLQIREL